MSTTAEDERLLFDVGKIKHIVQNAHVFAHTRTPRVYTRARAHTHIQTHAACTQSTHAPHSLTRARTRAYICSLRHTHLRTHPRTLSLSLSLSLISHKQNIYVELPRSLNTFGAIFSRSKTLMLPLWIHRSRAEYSYLQSYFSLQSTLKLPK